MNKEKISQIHKVAHELGADANTAMILIRDLCEAILEEEKAGTFDFDSLWKRYPKRLGKKEALRHFKATVKTDEDWQNINKALDNYLHSKNVKENTQFIQHGSTWFNNWQDWIELDVKKETPSALAMLKEKNLI